VSLSSPTKLSAYDHYAICILDSNLYLSNFVLTLNSQVALEDPKRYRIELTFSRGADLSPLEVIKYT
jgi:hypothetical protein